MDEGRRAVAVDDVVGEEAPVGQRLGKFDGRDPQPSRIRSRSGDALNRGGSGAQRPSANGSEAQWKRWRAAVAQQRPVEATAASTRSGGAAAHRRPEETGTWPTRRLGEAG